MKDEQIIELYWMRDEAAISQSNEKYGNYCQTIAMAILKSLPDAEECVNDTWFKSWQAMPPQRPSILKMFFAKITRNVSLDKYRELHAAKRGHGETEAAIDELAEVLYSASDVESEISAKELGAAINRFLHSLNDRDCGIFLRRYFYVEEISDIAKRFDLNSKNVLVILSRTRKKLKKHLEKEGYVL